MPNFKISGQVLSRSGQGLNSPGQGLSRSGQSLAGPEARAHRTVLWLLSPRSWLPLLGLLALAGCAKRETPVESAIRTQTLLRSLSADPVELDPHVISGLPEINVVTALFEGLVAEHPETLAPVPGVAESWEISPDGLTYTFRLRENARWSNGDLVTAADFVASYRRALTRSLGADYAGWLHVLRNGAAFAHGSVTDFAEVGVAAPDARTLILRLEHPAPHLLAQLSHPAWFPVHVRSIEQVGSPYERGTRWTRPETIVGNGAFVLRAWNSGQVITVEKSSTYWDAANVRLKAIQFRPASGVDAEERSYRGGQVHITEALPFTKIESWRREKPAELKVSPFLDTYFYRLNVTRPPLNNPKLRRALALAVDRPGLVREILRGGQAPVGHFVPAMFPDYTPVDGFATDFAAARALLAEMGHADGQGLPPLEITINNSANHQAIAEFLQATWRRELKLDVRILNMEQSTVMAQRRALNFQMLRSDWAGDYLDPLAFLEVFTSDSSNNHTGWKSVEFDRLVGAARRTADLAARAQLLREAEALLLAEAPIIPLYTYTTVRLVHPAVRGWHPNVLDRHPYKHVWLEE